MVDRILAIGRGIHLDGHLHLTVPFLAAFCVVLDPNHLINI